MTVRFGMIGTGQISYSGGRAVSAHDAGDVVAAQDLNEERLKAFCDEFDAKGYTQVEELLADDNVDAVYIAVPNKFHAPLAIQALEAGKHVLLEKPFSICAEDAEKVIAAAEKAGKAVLIGMNQRYRKDSQIIAAHQRKGTFGEVYHAKAYWMRRTGIPKLGTWFGVKEVAGGGALYDIGVHMLDLCLFCMNNYEVDSVMGSTYTKFGNRGLGEGGWGMSDRNKDAVFDVDDFASAQIRMKNGATVALDVSWACHTGEGNANNVELFGTEAGAATYPAKIFRYDPMRTEYDVIEKPAGDMILDHEDRFHNLINHLEKGEDLLVDIQQALTVQKILDAIYLSSKTGEQVKL